MTPEDKDKLEQKLILKANVEALKDYFIENKMNQESAVKTMIVLTTEALCSAKTKEIALTQRDNYIVAFNKFFDLWVEHGIKD